MKLRTISGNSWIRRGSQRLCSYVGNINAVESVGVSRVMKELWAHECSYVPERAKMRRDQIDVPDEQLERKLMKPGTVSCRRIRRNVTGITLVRLDMWCQRTVWI